MPVEVVMECAFLRRTLVYNNRDQNSIPSNVELREGIRQIGVKALRKLRHLARSRKPRD